MPVPATIDDLSTTAGSNSPTGGETPKDGDNYLRSLSSFIALLRDKLNGTSSTGSVTSADFSGTQTGSSAWNGTQTFNAGIEITTLSQGNVYSNTYAPTLTAGSNISGSPTALTDWFYTRVGAQIQVEGQITSTGTRTAGSGTLSEIYISLPVASALTLSTQLTGTADPGFSSDFSYGVIGDATGDRALYRFASGTTSGSSVQVRFTYRVI